jgi:hypothetical protein
MFISLVLKVANLPQKSEIFENIDFEINLL